MNRLILLIVLFISLTGVSAVSGEKKKVEIPEKELEMLDEALKNSKRYDNTKLQSIDSLKQELAKVDNKEIIRRWRLNMDIGDYFKLFSADSALNYYSESVALSRAINSDSLLLRSRISSLNAMSVAGLFPEAIAELDSLKRVPMSYEMYTELMKSGRQLYSYMLSYISGHEHFYDKYHKEYQKYEKILLDTLPKDSPYYKFIYAEHLIDIGQYKESKVVLEQLMNAMPDYTNLYGMSAYQMAEVYLNQGDEKEYARYLALSAISDIKGSVKETMSLPSLAQWLYEQGELNRAFNYINSSLKDAMMGNARMRTIEIARFVPMIDNAYRQQINSSRNELMVYVVLVTFLLIMSGVLSFFLMRQIKRIRIAQFKLALTGKVKDNYIASFIGMCSSYANKLDSMCKMVGRKLAAGQSEELLKLVKSGKLVEEQDDDFYKIFDNAFLDLYPNFVGEINKLLRPEEQIVLKKGQGLPAELRIYAFVRLGVDESVKISQILHYSVSTVYTYRNKMRNKAINRDTFESDVLMIGSEFE